VLCYITDRNQFSGGAVEKEHRLLEKIAECAACGVDFIQLREKDLSARELETLALRAIAAIPKDTSARLLINARTDVALGAGAHGVHLPGHDLPPSEVRALMVRAGRTNPTIGVSTHSKAEVALAEAHGADFAVFGPVFEKDARPNPQGVETLGHACRRPPIEGASMPVLALGGITLKNARECFLAGATGIAAIRLFQQNDVKAVVARLRVLFRH